MFFGCATQPTLNSKSYEQLFSIKEFKAPIGIPLTAETGEALFVEGSFIEGEYIIIDKQTNRMIPGSMGIPFKITIEAGKINMTSIVNGWKYFCVDMNKAKASFPGLGSVIREGDSICIRQSLSTGKLGWIVDNSNYNRGWGSTIWTSSMSKEEVDKYYPQKSNKPYRIRELTRIIFDGYYGNQLHFTLENIDTERIQQKEFTFDYKTGQKLPVSIKGYRVTILDADNINLKFQWDAVKRKQTTSLPLN
ncbi:MAG: hypothetical protein J7L04_13020 [Bacteroidales bacterium]|nr:hypothetical protein [Bacteroidales bacterium]